MHTTWSDGKASVLEMGEAARERGYEYIAICDHTRNVRVVPGLDADDVRRQAEEIAEANERLAPFRVLRGIECDILPDGTLDLPDDVLEELDWVQASVHAGQRATKDAMTKRVVEALRHPSVSCLSHPKGRIINHRPENALDLERAFEVALEEGKAVEVNGLPDRLDLRDVHVRLAVESGVPIVCSTDAHSTRGLGNMQLAVATARRGGATAADVVNTPLSSYRLAAAAASYVDVPRRVSRPALSEIADWTFCARPPPRRRSTPGGRLRPISRARATESEISGEVRKNDTLDPAPGPLVDHSARSNQCDCRSASTTRGSVCAA